MDLKCLLKSLLFRMCTVRSSPTCCTCFANKNKVLHICPKNIFFKEAVENSKTLVPGLTIDSEEKPPNDENLIPLSKISTKCLQYGDTSLISVCTDDRLWVPGVCLNLEKYEGRFRIKLLNSTQQVHKTYSYKTKTKYNISLF